MDRLSYLETFVAVAEAESFTAAAERLGHSRAVVSKHVQALERQLGIRLLDRTTRRVRLTDAGRGYLERARRALAELREAETEIRGDRASPRGTLRVSGPVSFGRSHLAAAIPDFLAAYPDLRVELTVNDRMVDLIEEGYDVAVRVGRLADSSLVARRLAPVRLILVASPAYLMAHRAPAHPDELSGHTCLEYAYSGRPWRFDRNDESGDESRVAIRPAGRFVANNGDVLLEAAVGGAGIALQPEFIAAPYLADGRLVPLLADWRPEPITVYAVHHQSRHVGPKIRAFVDHLAAWFRTPRW